MKRNIENLIKVRDFIISHGRNFSYSYFFETEKDHKFNSIEDLSNDCGTLGCVCGWAAVLSLNNVSEVYDTVLTHSNVSETYHRAVYVDLIEEKANAFLGLTDDEGTWLYYPWNEFTEEDRACNLNEIFFSDFFDEHQEAIDRLNHLISGEPIESYRTPQEIPF